MSFMHLKVRAEGQSGKYCGTEWFEEHHLTNFL